MSSFSDKSGTESSATDKKPNILDYRNPKDYRNFSTFRGVTNTQFDDDDGKTYVVIAYNDPLYTYSQADMRYDGKIIDDVDDKVGKSLSIGDVTGETKSFDDKTTD